MSCQARQGLLVLRGCGSPAIGACSSCGRMLCAMHLMGGACPDCAAMQGNTDTEQTREAAQRNSYYSTYGEGSDYGDDEYFNRGDGAPAAGFAAGTPAEFPAEDDYDAFDT